ncbi:unnamed protein product [Schistosoma margrebowiei]|uniref:Uncharacterized protein n=1 Tax=Schistosoma margrebowiei TaxID=48269 RepID=A0A183L9C3_9TREM|nr:unnamed protein product [Schistosoma margrebowiei]
MQEKTTSVAVVHSIHKGKSKILGYNTRCNSRNTIDGEDLGDVKSFIYLGNIIDKHGGYDADVKTRISKVRTAYLQLKNICKSK